MRGLSLYLPAILGVVGVVALSVTSCQKSVEEATEPVKKSSFDQLQDRILTTTCAISGCHSSEADGSYKQHQLILAAGKAYDNLVGVAPANAQAKADGLLRVRAFNSLQSLLYHKLSTAVGHHDGKQYGLLMPLGREALTVGQIEFVRRWIEAGAPKDGQVADSTLLDDKTPSVQLSDFEPLAAPPTGQGFQMAVGPFPVSPNRERELFVRKEVGNKTDVYVKRFQMKMRSGSHHFLAYAFEDLTRPLPLVNEVRDLYNPDGSSNLLTLLSMQNHVFLSGTQTPTYDYTFPEGAAMKISANASLDMNAHYVNKTDKTTTGEAYMNLYTVPASQVKHEVKSINLGNSNLNLPPKQRTTATRTFNMKKPVKILALTSHMHKLGEKFVIKIKGGARDGEIVYTSTDWQSPPILTFPTPLVLQAGEGLTSEITYNNTTDKTVRFGLSSDDEMGIIFGYYYEE